MRHPQINLTMAVIEHMMRTDSFVTAFPFIAAAKRNWHVNVTKRGGCGHCRQKRPGRETRVQMLDSVRSAIVGLPKPELDKLKNMLNTDKLVIYFLLDGRQQRREI